MFLHSVLLEILRGNTLEIDFLFKRKVLMMKNALNHIVRDKFFPESVEDIHGYHDTKIMHWLCMNCGTKHPVPFDGAGHVWFPSEWIGTCCENTSPKAVGI